MKTMIAAACLALASTAVTAQEVALCDWQARAENIVEPWGDFTATFANGNVRLALLDTVEPAAGAFHILIMSPPYDEIGARQCRTLGFGGGMGFAGVDFQSLEANYDPAIGLIFHVPVSIYDGTNGEFTSTWLVFTLNQATGLIESWWD